MSTSTERMRLHRQRRRNQLRCIIVELRDREVLELVRRGFIKPEEQMCPLAIRDALYSHLDHSLAARR